MYFFVCCVSVSSGRSVGHTLSWLRLVFKRKTGVGCGLNFLYRRLSKCCKQRCPALRHTLTQRPTPKTTYVANKYWSPTHHPTTGQTYSTLYYYRKSEKLNTNKRTLSLSTMMQHTNAPPQFTQQVHLAHNSCSGWNTQILEHTQKGLQS